MFNKLRKIPVIEILIILFLNIAIIIVGGIYIFSLLGIVENGIDPDVTETLKLNMICSFFIVGFYIGVYLDVFTLSVNRAFLKTIYYFKNHKVVLVVLLLILLLLSPSFLLGCFHFSFYVFIPGCYLSNGFPLIVLSLYSVLLKKISKRTRLGEKIIDITGRICIFLLTLLSLGVIFWVYSDLKIVFIDLWWLSLIIILLTVAVLITEETKVLIDWIKQKILYVIPVSVLLCYGLINGIKNEWVTYYTIYLFTLFYLIIILSNPLLALKTKNRAIMKEIESEDKTVQYLLEKLREEKDVR